MHQSAKRAIVIIGAGLAVAAALIVGRIILSRRPERPAPAKQAPEESVAPPMEFTKVGVPGKVVEAVEMVVRKGRVQAAVCPLRRLLWICVVVDGKERLYELGRDMTAASFPGLLDGGFKPVPSEMTRTTSIYRAVAKDAVPVFDEDRGDRILVLLCPKDEWPKLSLHWPAPPAAAK